jgi:hypothetical protein
VGRSGQADKSFAIPKQLVWEAYERVRANKGAAGVDGQSIAKDGKPFLSFAPAVSPQAMVKMSQEVRRWRLHLRTGLSLDELAETINPIVAGWMNYYGRFYRSQLYPLLQRINTYLMRWAGRKYKRLLSYRRFTKWWRGILDRDPELFTHWRWVRAFAGLR